MLLARLTIFGVRKMSTSDRVSASRLIYPVPQQAGLGIHLTLDVGGTS